MKVASAGISLPVSVLLDPDSSLVFEELGSPLRPALLASELSTALVAALVEPELDVAPPAVLLEELPELLPLAPTELVVADVVVDVAPVAPDVVELVDVAPVAPAVAPEDVLDVLVEPPEETSSVVDVSDESGFGSWLHPMTSSAAAQTNDAPTRGAAVERAWLKPRAVAYAMTL